MNNINHIRLVASDLDGTLLKKGESALKQEFLDMIKEIKDEGTDFAVASGRPFAELRHFFSSALCDMYYICENGALICSRGKTLLKKAIPNKVARGIIDRLESWRAEWAAAGIHTIYTSFNNKKVAERYKNEGLSIMKVQSAREIPEEILRLSVCVEESAQDWLMQDVCGIYAQEVSAVYQDDRWLDLVAAGVNKGAAVRWLCRYLKISPAEITVFGDNENDIELLGVTENSYAMDWAKEHVKKHAVHTTSCVLSSIREIIKVQP